MSVEYDKYLRTHLQNVRKAYDWLYDNIKGEFLDLDWGIAKIYCYETHDLSKRNIAEYPAYDKHYYPKNDKVNPSIEDDFKKAWLHHIHKNPHHWNHWVLVENKDNITALEMPAPYVIEMLSDWLSFSVKANDLSEIVNYYEKNKDKMILHPNTRKQVEKVINQINEIIEVVGTDIDE